MTNNQAFVYGEIAIDNIINVPHAVDREIDTFVIEDQYMIGGLASNVAVLLSLWQIPVVLSGYALGDDQYGRLMMQMLSKYPMLDLSQVAIKKGANSAFCRIIVPPNGDRYILAFNLEERVKDPTLLTEEMLGKASHFVLDCLAREESFLPAMKLAHRLGLCIIGSDTNSLDSPVIPYAHVICNSAGLLRKLKSDDVCCFSRRLNKTNGAIVITTDGPHAVHVIGSDGKEFWAHPLVIEDKLIVDTTGAGDSLKAGVTYGLVQGWPLERAVSFGVVVSGLIIQAVGAISREPKVEEVLPLIDLVRITKDRQGEIPHTP